MTIVPSISTWSMVLRIASTATSSALGRSPKPIVRAAAIAAFSTTRKNSRLSRSSMGRPPRTLMLGQSAAYSRAARYNGLNRRPSSILIRSLEVSAMVKLPFLLFSFLFLSLPIRENETTGNASQQDEEFPEVGYSIAGPDFTYSQEIPSLSGLDFKNFVVHTFDEKGRHFICGRLRDGYWKAVVEKGTTWEALTWVGSYPLSSASPQTEYVLVAFEYWGASGSSDSEGYAQVWQFQDKKLKIVLQIDANTHFGGPEDKYYSFDPEKQIL